MGRAPCCDKASVKRGPWSPEEDAKLKRFIEEQGTGGNWIALPQKIGLNRCGKSCRLRWLNYLRPNIKHGDFSEEEEHVICSLYISIGSRWSIIAAQLPGRTDNDIKNYWNTKLKKKLLGNGKRGGGGSATPAPRRLPFSRRSTANITNSGSNSQGTTLKEMNSSALERIQLLQGLYDHSASFSSFCSDPAMLSTGLPAADTLPDAGFATDDHLSFSEFCADLENSGDLGFTSSLPDFDAAVYSELISSKCADLASYTGSFGHLNSEQACSMPGTIETIGGMLTADQKVGMSVLSFWSSSGSSSSAAAAAAATAAALQCSSMVQDCVLHDQMCRFDHDS